MSTHAWYYLPTGKKSHAVQGNQLAAYPDQNAICGTSVLAFLPVKARWQHDGEGLAARERCATCTRLIEAELAEFLPEDDE